MALTELTALDNAYAALQPLGQAARRRALQWLSDALLPGHTLPEAAETAEPAAIETVAEVAAPAPAPARLRKAAAPTRASVSAPAPKARGGRRLKGGTHAPVRGERPYRRMPDPEAIMKAYRKVGSVSALADRFEVPRHTVNHWARRLRSQGYDIGRGN